MAETKRRTIRPYKVLYDEGCESWVVLDAEGDEQDYFNTKDEAMDAAVEFRTADRAGSGETPA